MSPSTTDRIEKSITINAPLARVWKALTDHREFGLWFRVNLESPFLHGQSTKGQITYPGYEHVVMRVFDVQLRPPAYFAFRWHPFAVDPAVDYSTEPTTLVEFSLEQTASGTLLRVTESGFDAIPLHRRDEAFRMNDGGWHEQVRNIDAYVAQNR